MTDIETQVLSLIGFSFYKICAMIEILKIEEVLHEKLIKILEGL